METRISIFKTMVAPISDTPSQNSRRRQNGQYNLEMQKETRLRNYVRDVSQMAEGLEILCLRETWLRPCDLEMAEMVDDAVSGPFGHAHNRGFGGVAMLINPLIQYKTVTKMAMKDIRSITIRARAVTVTGLYISRQTKRRTSCSFWKG